MKASQPQYEVKVEENVYVPVRDGVKLAVDIYRPDAPGKFPALLALSVYGKSVQVFDTPPQPFGSSVFEASLESGDPYFYVPRGYVYVIGDLRGTGDSEGEYVGLHSRQEGRDGADIVEWLAEQPWCDGNVATAGICQFGVMQLQIAIEQPPHLRAICPWEVPSDDLYAHGAYRGGVLNLFFYGLYTGTHPARVGFAPKNVVSAMIKDTPEKELRELVDEALADPDLRQYPYLYHLLKYPSKNPIMFDFMVNPLDGPFYEERSVYGRLDKVTVPTYVGGPLFGIFPEGQVSIFNRLEVPKKMFLYSDMGTRPWRAHHDELLRWYDYWLKGIDTGIMDEAPIRYHTTGAERWATADTWPLEETVWQELYLNSLQQLLPEPDLFNDEPDAFVQQPLYVKEKRERVAYQGPPLSGDLQVTGSPRITFYASIDATDTNFRVDLYEEGKPMTLSQGWLKASHRALDPERSTAWEIAHDHTRAVPVAPGEICEYTVQLTPFSHLFKAGSRIRLEISSIDIPTDPETYDVWWHVCSSRTILHKIYRDSQRPSVLSLPVIPTG